MTRDSADPLAALDREVARQALGERASRAITAARSRLVLGRDATSAFFATLALRLTPEADDACPTLATDGRTLRYGPAFVDGLPTDELVGVVAHEVLHCALAHPARRGGRDSARWNVACDLAVNPLLVTAGFALPAGRLVPGEGAYADLTAGKSAEEYYARLPDPPPESSGDPGDGDSDPGGCGQVFDPGDGSPAASEAVTADWRVAVAQAEQAARGRGDLPAGLARTVDKTVRPSADWRSLLRAFVTAHARTDYSWARPNRRLVWRGLYLPGLHADALGEVVVAVDTSGSVGPRELGAFAAALDGLLAAYDCTATVLYHDTAIRGVTEWRPADGEFTLAPVGGGGTSHVCVFDWVADSGRSPACVVCLTDLATRFPAVTPPVPVLWAVVGGHPADPPFGRRVAIDGGRDLP